MLVVVLFFYKYDVFHVRVDVRDGAFDFIIYGVF